MNSRFRRKPTLDPDLSLKFPVLIKGSHSIFIRHLDCGSCNGCELELNALANPVYDSARYGIHFEASPRHADILAMTGCFTRNLVQAARLTLDAMPVPRVIAIGDCALDGGIFKEFYTVEHFPPELVKAICARVPGCPPAPVDILNALLSLKSGK
jgi:Ni,Fe-hydrogenase III small subunit